MVNLAFSLPRILLAGVFVFSLTTLHGATITATNINAPAATNTITDSSGVSLTTPTSIVAVGFFSTLTDGQLGALNGTTFAQVATDFQLFGDTAPPVSTGFSIDGTYQFSTNGAINAGNPFIGKNIYTLIGNGATLLTSTEFLIFKDSQTFAQDSPVFSATVNLSRANETASGVDETKLIWGGYNNFTKDIGDGNGFTPSYNTLSAVPEPSRALLLLFGLGVCVLRRRRAGV